MKLWFSLLLLFYFNASFSQKEEFSANISYYFDMAGNFSVIDNKKDTVFSFAGAKRDFYIKNKDKSFVLKKRKILLNQDGDTVAYYKRKKIVFPQYNIKVKEIKGKNGWSYYLNNKKILEVNYTYEKDKKNYHIVAKVFDYDTVSLSALQICLGRFDKRVKMDYGNDDLLPLIIANIVSTAIR